MKNNTFPRYNTTNLKNNIFITLENGTATLKEISLEAIVLESGKSFIDQDKLKVNITIGKIEIELDGNIVNFKYLRGQKKYNYELNLIFNDLDTFKKWLAIIKGIHKARFK